MGEREREGEEEEEKQSLWCQLNGQNEKQRQRERGLIREGQVGEVEEKKRRTRPEIRKTDGRKTGWGEKQVGEVKCRFRLSQGRR